MMFPRLIYAANRRIGLRCLEILLEYGWKPLALLVPEGKQGEYVDEMIKIIGDVLVIKGSGFRKPEGVNILRELEPDYILSVHFPYVMPPEVLAIPKIGTLNLHPAYLPYNRGWHTPTWAILDGTPYGATLHWMDEGIDTGPIAIRRELVIHPSDTAHTLYQRVLLLEEELFRNAVPLMASCSLPKVPQEGFGSEHRMADIKRVQYIDLNRYYTAKELLTLLRALTTNRWSEAAYFTFNGVRYRIQVEIREEAKDVE